MCCTSFLYILLYICTVLKHQVIRRYIKLPDTIKLFFNLVDSAINRDFKVPTPLSFAKMALKKSSNNLSDIARQVKQTLLAPFYSLNMKYCMLSRNSRFVHRGHGNWRLGVSFAAWNMTQTQFPFWYKVQVRKSFSPEGSIISLYLLSLIRSH